MNTTRFPPSRRPRRRRRRKRNADARKKRRRRRENAKQGGSLWGPKTSEEHYAAIKAAIADFFALKDDTEIWYTGNKELWAHVSKPRGQVGKYSLLSI